ncbi:MmcQ/YjbR family DNA-binding protein [Succinivibrio dextrinosolvens]|uniref:MmcQ/YjbR family DNA-binding protein n=1 Tax=Succinivibrio dextrinosolvens TaxID=83771 RepID=UPI0019209C64|nr:MmcQ/YjbR family DNA-binding protein [Succinivibrio dextrinosolvens]
MDIEAKIFERKSVIESELISYGFMKTEQGFLYTKDFLNGTFKAQILISSDGKVRGKVIDNATDEEYILIHVENQTGAYVAKVRTAYTSILKDIASKCFRANPFLKPQSNRLTYSIEIKYQEKPDYPFAKLPTYGVFRYPANRKWYALIMNLKRSLVDKECTGRQKDEIVEVVNLKIDENSEQELLKIKGVFPGYHMNRAHWISIILDESLEDDFILELIDKSREFAVGKRVRLSNEKQHWIIPANPEFFNVIEYFSSSDEVIWKQSARLSPGDIAYIYVTSPLSEIRFICEVLQTDIPYEYHDQNLKMKTAVKLKVLNAVPHGFCQIKKMRELGVKAVRGQRTASTDLITYLKKNSSD